MRDYLKFLAGVGGIMVFATLFVVTVFRVFQLSPLEQHRYDTKQAYTDFTRHQVLVAGPCEIIHAKDDVAGYSCRLFTGTATVTCIYHSSKENGTVFCPNAKLMRVERVSK